MRYNTQLRTTILIIVYYFYYCNAFVEVDYPLLFFFELAPSQDQISNFPSLSLSSQRQILSLTNSLQVRWRRRQNGSFCCDQQKSNNASEKFELNQSSCPLPISPSRQKLSPTSSNSHPIRRLHLILILFLNSRQLIPFLSLSLYPYGDAEHSREAV